jgi:molybdenum-dependent DNA-binding transcriptional regulator ModE
MPTSIAYARDRDLAAVRPVAEGVALEQDEAAGFPCPDCVKVLQLPRCLDASHRPCRAVGTERDVEQVGNAGDEAHIDVATTSSKPLLDKRALTLRCPKQECRMDRLTSMAVFVRVAERGSFAATAAELSLSPTMIANHVRAIEARVGASLLDRTTRRHSLTEIGAAYLERSSDVLASVRAADHLAESLHALPQGTLRVSAPVSWGAHRLVPMIGVYMVMHLKVKVELSLNEHRQCAKGNQRATTQTPHPS